MPIACTLQNWIIIRQSNSKLYILCTIRNNTNTNTSINTKSTTTTPAPTWCNVVLMVTVAMVV